MPVLIRLTVTEYRLCVPSCAKTGNNHALSRHSFYTCLIKLIWNSVFKSNLIILKFYLFSGCGVCVCVCVLSCVWLFETLWTVAASFLCPWNFQARIPEGVAISFSRGSSQLRDQTHISCVSCLGRQIHYQWVTWKVFNSLTRDQTHVLCIGSKKS